jgi:hypothetical protein
MTLPGVMGFGVGVGLACGSERLANSEGAIFAETLTPGLILPATFGVA